jgi:ribosome biogenesis GTPase
LLEQGEDGVEVPVSETVVAKGDLSRRRTITEPKEHGDDRRPAGVVVAMRGLIADVDDGERVWPCTIRRILRTRRIAERNPVTVGDRVRFTVVADERGVQSEAVIEEVEPRQGTLSRVAGRRRQTIVANVDQAVIVASIGIPSFKSHLVDRYIVAAHDGGVEPIVCLNKLDLDTGGSARQHLEVYAGLGYQTLCTSVVTCLGVEELKATLAGKCSVIAGQSGVGKSSLLNAVDPRLNLRVGEVSTELQKGRHITTTARLIKLDSGGYVVDTPGVRSFDVAAVPINEVEMHFHEFVAFIPDCKFPDCSHTHELGCAVKAAVDGGHITAARYDSYCRILEERAREAQRLPDDQESLPES